MLAFYLILLACFFNTRTVRTQTAVVGQHAPARLPTRFELLLTVDPMTVPETGVVHFHVRLRSHEPTAWLVSLPMEEGPGASFEIHMKEHATGKEVASPFFPDAHLPPGPVHLTKIAANGYAEAQSTGRPQDFGITAGHTYDVFAIFHSPLHLQTDKGLPVLSASDGELRSNLVHFFVSR